MSASSSTCSGRPCASSTFRLRSYGQNSVWSLRPIASGSVRLDARTDVFQLGVLALELLLGRRLTRLDLKDRLPDLLDQWSTAVGRTGLSSDRLRAVAGTGAADRPPPVPDRRRRLRRSPRPAAGVHRGCLRVADRRRGRTPQAGDSTRATGRLDMRSRRPTPRRRRECGKRLRRPSAPPCRGAGDRSAPACSDSIFGSRTATSSHRAAGCERRHSAPDSAEGPPALHLGLRQRWVSWRSSRRASSPR